MVRRRGFPSVITVAAAAVVAGLLPMPYEYYVLLRFLLCGTAVWLLSASTGGSDVTRWVLVAFAILFNPIAPIELGRGPLWAVAHVGAVAYFWLVNRRTTRTPLR